MRGLIALLTVAGILMLNGCANPLNQATSSRYLETCYEAERNGRLDIAEEACYRALVNVDWGNLGEDQKGDRLYDLARIKRRLEKLSEAENLLLQAIEIEEKQNNPSNTKLGRRYAELAAVYGQQDNIPKGIPYVTNLIPIADLFSGDELYTVAVLLGVYSDEIKESDKALSEKFLGKAIELGFDTELLNN